MKGVYVGLTLASVAFMAFSWVCGQMMNDLRADLWGRDVAGRSRAEADRAWAAFEKDRSDLHLVVKLVSVVYFLGAAAILFVGSQKSAGRKGWRISLWVGSVVALIMAVWSLLLSGAISFDEVFGAWLGASGALGVLSVTCLCASIQSPVPHQVVGRQ